MKTIYEFLAEQQIPYEKYEHEPLFTAEDGLKLRKTQSGGHAKNLFLRSKKEKNYYLVVIEISKRANLKALAQTLGQSDFTFASPEELLDILGVTPGSVSPFALINDQVHKLQVIVDMDLLREQKVYFHPNINTATLGIAATDFLKFLNACGHNVQQLAL